jgi:pimeloyl-ACP methyl ester carboxylesterase/DNA-binding CsgD family transcriptional regulator
MTGVGAGRQTVQFCRSADGVRIAYARYGSGPPVIVSTCWLTHLEHDLQSPVWRHFVEGVASIATTVRYDERGHGLSDWSVPDFAFESRVADLEAVVEASGFERFALLGMSQGGPVAVAYAHRHPERVTRLVLHGSYAATIPSTDEARELDELYVGMIKVGWARPEGRFRRVFTDMLMPGASDEHMSWVDELMRTSTSVDNAIAFREARQALDVRALLPEITVPTLVLHARGDQTNPVEEGRELAAGIPGARMVTLDSANHVLLADDPAWPVFLHELDAFLEPDRVRLAVPEEPSPEELASPAASGTGRPGGRGVLGGLSTRELEVLDLVADGLDNREIAEALTLSVRTVERHLQTIYRKLDLTGSAQRTAAAAMVLGTRAYAPAAGTSG